MDILYLFGFSEITGNHLERLLPLIKIQIQRGLRIGFVLMHDGVIGITTKGRIPKPIEELLSLDLSVYAMIPDIKARGIDIEHLHNKVKPVEYDELVDILDNAQKITSWI